MLTPRSYRILALPLLLLMSTGCGKWARAKRELPIDTVAMPSFPKVADDVFSLSGAKPEITYRTTMLIINEKTDPALLAEVLNASIGSRDAFAEARNYEITHDYKNLYGDSGLEILTQNFMKKDLQTFELQALQKNPISPEQKAINARDWIDSEIAALGLSPEQKASFDASWGAYCEAKIVELASNSIFASSTYKSLPTPQPFCAAYYENKALLAGPSCSAPADGNFFTCLWQEGVLKTRWFQPKAALPSTATPEAVAAVSKFNAEMKTKRDTLTSLLTQDPAGLQKVIALNPEKVGTGSKVTPNFFVSLFTEQLAKQPGNNVVWCTTGSIVLKDAAFKPLCTLFSIAPLEQSPADWIDSMEGRRQGASLVNLPTPPDRKATTQQIIRYVAERDKGKSSEADRLFHSVAASTKTLDVPLYEGAGPEFFAAIDEVRSILAPVIYGTLAPEDQNERELRLQNIAARQATIDKTKAELKVLQDKTNESIDRGLKATNAGDVAFGFIEIRFHFKQLGQVLLGEFWPKDSEVSNRPAKVFRGCFDVSTQTSIDCGADLPGLDPTLTVFPAKLYKDPDTGRIDFSMVVTDPEAMTLDTKARVDTSDGSLPNYFMDFSADVFRNQTLRFELYPNRLREYLDILTGKMFLNDGTKDLYEGGISGWELWDF